VGFGIAIRPVGGLAPQGCHHSVVAQRTFLRALQVHYTRQRHHSLDAGFVRREAKGKLSSCGMAHHHNKIVIHRVTSCVPSQKMICGPNVAKRSRPRPAFIAHAPVFDICRRYPLTRKCGTEMCGMSKIVLSAPEATVYVDHQRRGTLLFSPGKAEIKKLIRIGTVGYPLVSRWRGKIQNIV
jgi:hypothetical protein